MLLPFEVPQSTWGRGNGTGKIHRLETFKKTAGSTWSLGALKSYRARAGKSKLMVTVERQLRNSRGYRYLGYGKRSKFQAKGSAITEKKAHAQLEKPTEGPLSQTQASQQDKSSCLDMLAVSCVSY